MPDIPPSAKVERALAAADGRYFGGTKLAFIVDVFLSSTAEDLKKYAEAVYARLNGHEMFRCTHQRDFGARDEAVVNYCRERVLKAELYVGVFGMRRGWEPKDDDKKRSITQMEHDWARESGKPRFLYVTPASLSGRQARADDHAQTAACLPQKGDGRGRATGFATGI
jgi:hypothetical protein